MFICVMNFVALHIFPAISINKSPLLFFVGTGDFFFLPHLAQFLGGCATNRLVSRPCD